MTAEQMLPMHAVHLGVAEHGKVLALEGQHANALRRYREALHLARRARAPQIVARHYLHCILESLEHLGAHDEMIALCREAVASMPSGSDSEFSRRDRAHLLERQGVAELKAGADTARATLELAVREAGSGALPLAEMLVAWLARGLTVTSVRLAEAQRRTRYYVVRPELVDAARAIASTGRSGDEPWLT